MPDRNPGFDGRLGRGYGAPVAPSDRPEGFDGRAYGGGMAASDYERSPSGDGPGRDGPGRDAEFGADDRSWVDLCADDECAGRRRHHAGRGPKDWSRSDQALYVEVCERLMADRLIDARGLEVEVEDGVVTLRGRAAAPADPALIERLVRETPGVKGLDMNLAVGGDRSAPRLPEPEDDAVDHSSLAAPILARRAPPPDPAGAP